MATHEKELTRAAQDIEIYKAMASGQWNKEDELRSLKAQAAELDRKIALTLAPVEEVEGRNEAGRERTAASGRRQHTPNIYGALSYTKRLILLDSTRGFPPR